MNELATQLGVGGGFAVVIIGMILRFLKDQKNGLPVVKEKVAVLERNTENQWKAIDETRDTVNRIDKKIERKEKKAN